ncbi:MAG: RHS repeat-associated core domain-containing protein [Bacteroidota bacterium]
MADFTQPWLETELTTWTSQPALEDWLDNPSMFYQALVGDPTRTDAAGYLVESVPMGTRMQWRVRAEGPGWASAWAQPKGFETEPAVVSRHYFVKDHLGSPRAVVDETGQVVEYRDHYPFGLEMPGRTYVSGVESRENFTGHERDTETGLVYAGARYYDPVIGSWTGIDPLADDLIEWSPYLYAMNNPLRLVDPDGRAPVDTLIYDGRGTEHEVYYAESESDYAAVIMKDGSVIEVSPDVLQLPLQGPQGPYVTDGSRSSGNPAGTIAQSEAAHPATRTAIRAGGHPGRSATGQGTIDLSIPVRLSERTATIPKGYRGPLHPGVKQRHRTTTHRHQTKATKRTASKAKGGGIANAEAASDMNIGVAITKSPENGSMQAWLRPGGRSRYQPIGALQLLGLYSQSFPAAVDAVNQLR